MADTTVEFDQRVLSDWSRHVRARLERGALFSSDRLAREGVVLLRRHMSGARLGKLGNALGNSSDLSKSGAVHTRPDGSFSATGTIFVRSQSQRTRGAIEAYTQGAEITPQKGPWLWIPSPELYQRVRLPGGSGSFRITPALYNQRYAGTLGPLVFVRGKHSGEARLIVRNVQVRTADGRRPIAFKRSVRAGRTLVEEFTAFIGIKRTSRAARLFPRFIIRQLIQTSGERLFLEGVRRG